MTSPQQYEDAYRVRVYEADKVGRLTPVSAFNYFQETAGQASRTLGRGYEVMKARAMAWFLNRFHLEFLRYPRIGETVHVRTWPYKMERHASIREFEMVGENGQPLVRATSQWVLINLQTRRLTRVPEDIREAYPIVDRRMIEDRFLRLPLLSEASSGWDFHVRLSDLDVNQHANSASYIDWCLEAVPEETHELHVPLRFEINYLREASVRETLSSQSQAIDATEGAASAFAHQIIRQTDGTRLAVGRSQWGAEPGL